RHTHTVLEEFGRSLGQVETDGEQAETRAATFLASAVEGLVGSDGRVIPARLSLFVEVVRHRPWTKETLTELGGVEGIGVKFLEEAFDSSTAPPASRLHRKAAEGVLKLLLPPPTSLIQGPPRSGRALLAASGYIDRPDAFAQLIQMLDHDLRLIKA